MDETPEAPPRARAKRRPLIALVLVIGAALVATAVIAFKVTETGEWRRSGPPITVDAWVPYWQTESGLESFTANVGVFRSVSLFSYRATAAETVSLYDGADPNSVALFRAAAEPAGVELTASVIDDTPAGTMATILADPATRATHVQAIARLAREGDFDGIDLDYEKFAFSDGRATWAATRPNWVAFVEELAAALHGEGRSLTVSVPPVYDGEQTPDSGYWVYDYEAIGKVVDHIRIMAYDFSTSDPGPIAPIDWVSDLVAAAKDLVPAKKLILGVPVYGYDWVLSVSGTCPGGPDDAPRRSNVSTKSAAYIAAGHSVVPTFLPDVAESTFNYSEVLTGTDAAGAATSCTVARQVHYADARAVHARAWLAERQDLAGISLWSLGSDDSVVWEAIDAARADHDVWPAEVPADSSTTSTLPLTSIAATSTTVAAIG